MKLDHLIPLVSQLEWNMSFPVIKCVTTLSSASAHNSTQIYIRLLGKAYKWYWDNIKSRWLLFFVALYAHYTQGDWHFWRKLLKDGEREVNEFDLQKLKMKWVRRSVNDAIWINYLHVQMLSFFSTIQSCLVLADYLDKSRSFLGKVFFRSDLPLPPT